MIICIEKVILVITNLYDETRYAKNYRKVNSLVNSL